MPATALRERLTRLGRPTADPTKVDTALPRGFRGCRHPVRRRGPPADVVPLPALEPNPGSVAYVDTETTGLSGGAEPTSSPPLSRGQSIAGCEWRRFSSRSRHGSCLPACAASRDRAGESRRHLQWQLFRPACVAHPLGDGAHAWRACLSSSRGPAHPRQGPVSASFGELQPRSVEERLLGYEREDPIASALVPDAYFEYLRYDSSPCLRRRSSTTASMSSASSTFTPASSAGSEAPMPAWTLLTGLPWAVIGFEGRAGGWIASAGATPPLLHQGRPQRPPAC